MGRASNSAMFDTWKAEVLRLATEKLSISDVWAADDPYDLFGYAGACFETGVSAERFFNEIFSDDLARLAGDEALAEDSAIANTP